MNVEEICEPITLRILYYMFREGQSNITRIARDLQVHHRVIRRRMEKLVKAGIVSERRYEKLHIYMLNMKNPRVSALKDLLLELKKTVEMLEVDRNG
jgi:predicted ArsR family transcriptional regulator